MTLAKLQRDSFHEMSPDGSILLKDWRTDMTHNSPTLILGQDSSAGAVGTYLCEVAQTEEFRTLHRSIGSIGTMVLRT